MFYLFLFYSHYRVDKIGALILDDIFHALTPFYPPPKIIQPLLGWIFLEGRPPG